MRLLVFLLLWLLAAPASAAEYALLDASNTILELANHATQPTDPTGKGWRWLPVVRTMPSYNPETEVRTGPVTTVLADSVTLVWTVRAMTAGELDAVKTANVDSIAVAIIRALCNHENRLRDLQRFARAVNNNQANTAGIPSTANSQALTFDDCKALFKTLIP